MSRRVRVLVVDDEAYVRDSLREILELEGFQVSTAAEGREAARILQREPVDVVVADLSMPGGDGIELLEATARLHLRVPVIIITGVGTVPDAVAAMKHGAHDLLQKPVAPAELVRVVQRAAEHRSLVGEVHRLRDALEGIRGARRLVGESSVMETLREQLASVARTEATVLVHGESGTGKELAAEELHRLSDRVERPFVHVSCAGGAAGRLERELFGHVENGVSRAGRIEQAEGGTLVLDEVGFLSREMQEALLRVLDTGESSRIGEVVPRMVDARIVALTNQDLAAAVERGSFRADLYYRLSAFPVRMPPLREHLEDLEELVRHLLERMGAPPPDDAAQLAEVVEVLGTYEWPGNVRELKNVIERAVIVGGGLDPRLIGGILESTLALQGARASVSAGEPSPPGAPGRSAPHGLHLRTHLDAREKELLQRAIAESGGRKKDAAALLGVDARNLGYYLRKHGLQ